MLLSAATGDGDVLRWVEVGTQLLLVFGVFFAAFQVRLARLASLLAAEESLANARARYVDTKRELELLNVRFEIALDGDEVATAEQLLGERTVRVAHLKEVYTQFLNRLDRICASVKRRELSRRHAREDYAEMVEAACEDNPAI